jgi:hypothetical protein
VKAEQERLAREQAERDKAAAPIKEAELTPPADNPAAPSAKHVLAGGALVEAIKKELARVGCYSGPIDDKWPSSQAAVGKYLRAAHAAPNSDEPSADFLDALRGKTGRVCPLECGDDETESHGRCVAKACREGFTRDGDGDCVREKARAKAHNAHEETETHENRHRSAAPSRVAEEAVPATPPMGFRHGRGPGGGCFGAGGRNKHPLPGGGCGY